MQKLKNLLNGEFAKDMSWQGLAELSIRLTRLITAVVLARVFSPEYYGIVALALTTSELVNVISRNGIGQKLIQVKDSELSAMSNTAYRLNWRLNIGLFVLQSAIAYPVAQFYNAPELFPLILTLALVYLIYPWAMVQVFLTQRAKNLKQIAIATGLQISVDNVLCAILALSGFGLWSVVLPKIIVAIIWVLYFRKVNLWRSSNNKNLIGVSAIFDFGKKILGTELLKVTRLHFDKLIIGHFLGLEALGLYYFAMNAGLGISLSLVSAFNITLYPHLCAVNQYFDKFKQTYFKALKIMAIAAPVIMLSQSIFAPWYVPLIFGEQWIDAIGILILLTLSGIPRPFAEGASQMLRAINQPQADLHWNLIFTALFIVVIVIAVQFNLLIVAFSILLLHILVLPIFVGFIHKKYLVPRYFGGHND